MASGLTPLFECSACGLIDEEGLQASRRCSWSTIEGKEHSYYTLP